MGRSICTATRSVSITLGLLLAIVYVLAVATRVATKDSSVQHMMFSSVPESFMFYLTYGLFPDHAPLYRELAKKSLFMAIVTLFISILVSLTFLNMLVGVLVEVVKMGSVSEKNRSDILHLDSALTIAGAEMGFDTNRLTQQQC